MIIRPFTAAVACCIALWTSHAAAQTSYQQAIIKLKSSMTGKGRDCKTLSKPKLGMIMPQVIASCWGKPRQINTTHTQAGKYEQLVYGVGRYVYLTNGLVTSIQESR
jgi:hypothetical protein